MNNYHIDKQFVYLYGVRVLYFWDARGRYPLLYAPVLNGYAKNSVAYKGFVGILKATNDEPEKFGWDAGEQWTSNLLTRKIEEKGSFKIIKTCLQTGKDEGIIDAVLSDFKPIRFEE